MTTQVTRTYRGISTRLAMTYLQGLGGERVGEGEIQGDGWAVSLSAETVGIGPTLEISEVTVEFTGEADQLDELIESFSQKAIRAGG